MGAFNRILGREGAYPRTSSTFYKAVVQATLLFGSETWVMNLRIGRTLGGFQKKFGSPSIVVIPASGHRNGSCGDREGGCICTTTREHHRPIYCDFSDTGNMSGGGTSAGSTDVTTVAGAGHDRPGDRKGENVGALTFGSILDQLEEKYISPHH